MSIRVKAYINQTERKKTSMAVKTVICLAGFAAVGKSNVGMILAKKMGLKYLKG